jgi:hypothetical protein
LAAIARIGDIICAFLGGEVCERLSDGFDEGVKRSCGGLAKCGFELGEGLFDGIEVGAIGREIAQRRAGPLDRFFDASDFVTGKIIHDDDIAMAQGRGEKVLDIGQETRSVHRTVKYTGCGDLIVAQGGNECWRHPMAMRHGRDEPLPTQSPPIEPRHVGLRPSFINEDKIFRIQIGLTRKPFVTGFGDIRAVLFGGAQ